MFTCKTFIKNFICFNKRRFCVKAAIKKIEKKVVLFYKKNKIYFYNKSSIQNYDQKAVRNILTFHIFKT